MPSKMVSPPFQLCASVSMTGVTTYISSVTGILYRDSFAYQWAWTGTPSGNFDVQGSIDYNPGLPESAGTTLAGTWTSIPLTPVITITGSGGAINAMANVFDAGFPYVRFAYTNSTGSGVMAAYVSGKSYG